jgi:hypothetical protein
MTGTYDIFSRVSNSGPIWVEAVQGLENARKRVMKLCETHPGDYFVFDSSTATIIDASDIAAM